MSSIVVAVAVAVSDRLAVMPDALIRLVASWLDFTDHCRFAASQHRVDALVRHPSASSPKMTIRVSGPPVVDFVTTFGACTFRVSPRKLTVTGMDVDSKLCARLAVLLPELESLNILTFPSVDLDCRSLLGFRKLVWLDTRGAHLTNDHELHNFPDLRDLTVRGRDRPLRWHYPDFSGRLSLHLKRFDSVLGPPPLLAKCANLVSLGFCVEPRRRSSMYSRLLTCVFTSLPVLECLTVRDLWFDADGAVARALLKSDRSSHLRSLALPGCTVDTKMRPSLLQRIGAHVKALERLEVRYIARQESRGEDPLDPLTVSVEDAAPLAALERLVSLSIESGSLRPCSERRYGLGVFSALEELTLSVDYPLDGLVAPQLRLFNDRVLDRGQAPAHISPGRRGPDPSL
jgi:hypothetical protein